MVDIDVYLFMAIDYIHHKRWDLIENIFEIVVIEWRELFDITADDFFKDVAYLSWGDVLVRLDWIFLMNLNEFLELCADFAWHWLKEV
jgi:hypothetical protein